MRKILRFSAVTAALIIGAAALHRYVYLPYRCNQVTLEVEIRTRSILDRVGLLGPQVARENVATLKRWIGKCRGDPNVHMLMGANLQILQRFGEAAAVYEAALRYERRPELYLNLGLCQLETGDHPSAVANLARAVLFDRRMQAEVPPPLREEVRTRVALQAPAR